MLIISTRPVAPIIHAVSAGSILAAGAWARAAVEAASTVVAVSTEAIVARALPVMLSSPCFVHAPLWACLTGRADGRPRRARTCPVHERRAIGLIGKATGCAAAPQIGRGDV